MTTFVTSGVTNRARRPVRSTRGIADGVSTMSDMYETPHTSVQAEVRILPRTSVQSPENTRPVRRFEHSSCKSVYLQRSRAMCMFMNVAVLDPKSRAA